LEWVWNGVQWSVLQTTGFVCSVKEQESDGRKESREYHVHGVLGTKVFGKITLSAGVVVVGVARVGVVGHVLLIEWICQTEFMDRIRHEFFLDTCIKNCRVLNMDISPLSGDK